MSDTQDVDHVIDNTLYDLDNVYAKAGEEYGVDPNLLRALVKQESGGKDSALSPVGAGGRAQIMPATAKALGVTNVNDPEQAIPAAAKYLREGLDAHGGDVNAALKYYHGGPDTAQWGPKTNAYAQNVQAIYKGLGPAPAPSPDTSDIDKLIDSTINPAEPKGAKLKPATITPAEPWGASTSLVNALSLGALKPGVAAMEGGLDALSGKPGTFAQNYQRHKAALSAGQDQYAGEHPTQNLVMEGGGLVVPVTGIEGLVAKGAEALGSKVASIAPSLAPAVKATGRFHYCSAGRDVLGNTTSRLLNTTSNVASGALQGGGAGLLATGVTGGDPVQNMLHGAETGAVLNPLISPLHEAATFPLRATAHPNVASLMNQPLKSGETLANALGMRGGQISNQPGVVKLDNALGHGGDQQLGNWTRELSKTFSDTPLDSLTDANMDTAKSALGAKFNKVAGMGGVVADQQLVSDLKNVTSQIQARFPAGSEAGNLAKHTISQIAKTIKQNNGTLPGDTYQMLTQMDSTLGDMIGSDAPGATKVGMKIKDALDDAFGRSNPKAQQALQEVRGQYKNYIIAKKIQGKAAATGVLDPTLLKNQVENVYGSTAKAGDMGLLAEAGKYIPKPTTQGFAKTAGGHPLGMGSGLAMGALGGEGLEMLGHLHSSPEVALMAGLGAGGGLMAKNAVRKYMASPEYMSKVIENSLWPKPKGFQPNLLLPPAAGLQLMNPVNAGNGDNR